MFLVFCKQWFQNVFRVMYLLILAKVIFTVSKHLKAERWYIRLVFQFRNGRKKYFKIKDNGTRERKPTKSLPINAQIYVFGIQR